MRYKEPRFAHGDKVVWKPPSLTSSDMFIARVTDIHWALEGLEYDIRYVHNGEPKTCRVFEDELTMWKN